jgi:hypothetical protein
MLGTMDAQSTALLTIELASARSAETGRRQCEALEHHHVFSLGMASERGQGVGAGSQLSSDMAWWGAHDGHACRDLCEVRPRWERTA